MLGNGLITHLCRETPEPNRCSVKQIGWVALNVVFAHNEKLPAGVFARPSPAFPVQMPCD